MESLSYPEDDSMVTNSSEDYEMTEKENFGIFIGAMCEFDFYDNHLSVKNSVEYTTHSFTQETLNQTDVDITQTQDSTSSATQDDVMTQPVRVSNIPCRVITLQ